MSKSFNLRNAQWTRRALRDPRVAMRIVIGALLAANLGAAVWAFNPFGGSVEDIRREEAGLNSRLAALEKSVAADRKTAANVETARRQGTEFLTRYFTDMRTHSSTLADELYRTWKEAGIRPLPTSNEPPELVEGSSSLYQTTISVGYEGTYANLRRFIDLVDKSPRFLIIENMTVTSPQQQAGQVVNVALKLDAFVREAPGAGL